MSSKAQNEKRKILAVDDDLQSLKIVRKALEWAGYQVDVAANGQEAIDKISNWDPHLVLLDVNMPGLNGIETLKLLRESREYISVIFISAKTTTEDVVRGLDVGADDYICKPYDSVELLARIRCHLRIKDIRDELDVANHRLKEMVERDDLTDLFNMRSLYNKLDYELDRAKRYNRAVSVVMMDMDHFKLVNDQNDHLFGSFVLSQVGKIIKENIRKVDFAARYGGDEFLIVLTETNVEGAQTFCERLRLAIERHDFESDQHKRQLTASLGFAITAAGEKTIDARTLVRFADQALYKAKEKGRNRVEVYNFSDEKGMPTPPKMGVALRGRRKII